MKREEKEAAVASAATNSRWLWQLLMTRTGGNNKRWDGDGDADRSGEKEERMGKWEMGENHVYVFQIFNEK
ncbi:hypothetical protein H5410_056795 [Solanum commersonii]|uniref:Uncharacterized protein n=1 Tax=Solanum commersonii TaxID=4109 RepID=A0A9J5WMT3_SOLCO|nr:hypothetical protein H5410_056795 [Solanum commersonii]